MQLTYLKWSRFQFSCSKTWNYVTSPLNEIFLLSRLGQVWVESETCSVGSNTTFLQDLLHFSFWPWNIISWQTCLSLTEIFGDTCKYLVVRSKKRIGGKPGKRWRCNSWLLASQQKITFSSHKKSEHSYVNSTSRPSRGDGLGLPVVNIYSVFSQF